jgi:hypothetical protein
VIGTVTEVASAWSEEFCPGCSAAAPRGKQVQNTQAQNTQIQKMTSRIGRL